MELLNIFYENGYEAYVVGGFVRNMILGLPSFDVDIATSMSRVGSEKDRMESAGQEFFNRVRNGYLELAKQEPDRIKVIDSTKSIEEVQKSVIENISKFI